MLPFQRIPPNIRINLILAQIRVTDIRDTFLALSSEVVISDHCSAIKRGVRHLHSAVSVDHDSRNI